MDRTLRIVEVRVAPFRIPEVFNSNIRFIEITSSLSNKSNQFLMYFNLRCIGFSKGNRRTVRPKEIFELTWFGLVRFDCIKHMVSTTTIGSTRRRELVEKVWIYRR